MAQGGGAGGGAGGWRRGGGRREYLTFNKLPPSQTDRLIKEIKKKMYRNYFKENCRK